MIASLPMYLFPETRAAHVAFWSLVRDALRGQRVKAPKTMNETWSPHAVWSSPDLSLSHICNLPYRLEFRDHLTRIAASDYGLEGCDPGYFRSLFVVRDDHWASSPEDLDGARMVINADDSQSGWGAPSAWAAARGLRFDPVLWSGSHENSLGAVIAGEADFAAIDAQSFALLQRLRPIAHHVRVIGATDQSPGMTFVTRAGQDPEPYRRALDMALASIEERHREMLGLRGVVVLPEAAYDLPLPPDPRTWQS